LSPEDMKQISDLDTGKTHFLSYHDPKFAKMLGTLRVDL